MDLILFVSVLLVLGYLFATRREHDDAIVFPAPRDVAQIKADLEVAENDLAQLSGLDAIRRRKSSQDADEVQAYREAVGRRQQLRDELATATARSWLGVIETEKNVWYAMPVTAERERCFPGVFTLTFVFDASANAVRLVDSLPRIMDGQPQTMYLDTGIPWTHRKFRLASFNTRAEAEEWAKREPRDFGFSSASAA